MLFDSLHDKDIFVRHYEKLTAMRLVNETSASYEAETKMIEILSKSYGLEEMRRLKQMFTDITESDEIMRSMMTLYRPTETDLL